MMKKLGIILFSISFLLSAFSLLPVKRASANTGSERCMLMAAEPWNWWYHSGKGGSGGSSGSAEGGNQAISDPANHFITKHPFSNSTQTSNYQRKRSMKEKLLNWRLKLLLFWQMIFRG